MGSVEAMKIINVKAINYLETQTAKQTHAVTRVTNWNDPQHYGIEQQTPLGIDNLYSLILYTDFTDLSSDFSRSFRKIHPFETIQNVKIRNSYYWWWSKILRETVELYGITKYGRRSGWNHASRLSNAGLEGPFFTGLSFVMYIPQYVVKLNSPTSTSLHIEVATKFSGQRGMIIQLDVGDDYLMKQLSGFDCSWISKFKEEHEMYICIYVCIFCFYQQLLI